MEAKLKTTNVTTLVLNEEEANWLMSVMQNPIGHCDKPRDEDRDNMAMRERFYRTLIDLEE